MQNTCCWFVVFLFQYICKDGMHIFHELWYGLINDSVCIEALASQVQCYFVSELYVLPYGTQVFPFLARTDTNIIQCYVHFVQINTVLSIFTSKNSSCDPYLKKRGEKKPRLVRPIAGINQPGEYVKL